MKSILADLRTLFCALAAIVGCLNGIAVVWLYHLGKDWQYMAFLSLYLLAIANSNRGRE